MKLVREIDVSLLGCALALAACIGSSPPAPPVRWFDCSPEFARSDAKAVIDRPAVRAAFRAETDFALRVGPHEIRLDPDHRWTEPPDRIAAAAIERALYVDADCAVGRGRGVDVTLLAFEFDLRTSPAAVVALTVPLNGRVGAIFARAPASSARPEDLAAAMASALGDAVSELRDALVAAAR
ncbi:MAG: hypothetical protein Fur0037_29260 [Planctomycetota bacterium]